MNAAILEKEALLLPDNERALLVDRLIESLSRASPRLEDAWLREVDSRYEAFCNGEIKAVDGSVGMAKLRAKFPR